MKAGVSTKDMTFPELIGHPSIHDPLFAKALVLDDGENTLAIICLDIVDPFFPEVRERIQHQLGIQHTLVNCSHTHTDGRDLRIELPLADRSIRCVAVNPGGMRTAMRAAAYPDEDPATLPRPSAVVAPFVAIAAGADPGPRIDAAAWGARWGRSRP